MHILILIPKFSFSQLKEQKLRLIKIASSLIKICGRIDIIKSENQKRCNMMNA